MANLSTLNEIKDNQINKCAVKSCKNAGVIEVRVRFINKCGKFCNRCKNELKEQGLIEYKCDKK